MGSTTAEIIPAALGMLLVNPLPVTASIVLLFSPRARTTAPAFVAGWVLGMLLVLGILLFVVPLDDEVGNQQDPTTFASLVKLAIGVLLLGLAYRQWGKRPKEDEAISPPGMITKLEQANPLSALLIGASLSCLNPKNLAFTIAASLTIAQAHLTLAQKILPVSVFIVVASIGVAAPVAWYFVAHDQASKTLAGWRVWLTDNYATIMAVVLVIFGVILASQAIAKLIA